MGDEDLSLIKGNVHYNCEVSVFLANLASWFNVKRDIELAKKIVSKAEVLFEPFINIVDKHFYFMNLLKIYYKDRENSDSFEKSIMYCNRQIEISKELKFFFMVEYSVRDLPVHT